MHFTLSLMMTEEIFAAGPPGFEPETFGAKGSGFINYVSNKKHQVETSFTNDYLPWYQHG